MSAGQVFVSNAVNDAFNELYRGNGRAVLVIEQKNGQLVPNVEHVHGRKVDVTCLAQSLSLPDQDVVYLFLRCRYATDSGATRKKIVFVPWIPDSIVRPTLKESAALKFHGVTDAGRVQGACNFRGIRIGANRADDLSLDIVRAKLLKGERDALVGEIELDE